MAPTENTEALLRNQFVADYRRNHPEADLWAAGYRVIQHSPETQARVFRMAQDLESSGIKGDGVPLFDLLYSLDRVTSAGMWLIVHQTYARNVYLSGQDLAPDDFRESPEGHTGGSLNMAPAYAGYMAANVIAGDTRSWIMGQGHCVAAIDSLNLLLNNMTPAHAERYSIGDEGLTRYVRDFYSYRFNDRGEQDSPLGSHVNAYTAGGLAEGGYLGFVELQYMHMPLPGESLVAFLSDGAFEEQRGSDWAPRWWRSQDSGRVMPIMIANGRRIDQRTTMSQQGGVDWFEDHLDLNSFDPLVFDGRDPAAFVWAIYEMERRLDAAGEAIRSGLDPYPARLPHGIAVAPKGAGFPGEGTNLAHNLPLPANPRNDAESAGIFNEGARRLWVPQDELEAALARFKLHGVSGRPEERNHPLACRKVQLAHVPPAEYRQVPENRSDSSTWTRSSPMEAIDKGFLQIVQANPHLRPRIGNPDEMRSNRMQRTLDALKFRVTAPEEGLPETVDGAVITALNEEAVVSAALANKGGMSIAVTYEAFGTKMYGAMRQEVTFADHLRQRGREPEWLSIPLVLTSHTWENSKNEQSHQDPTMAEAMLGEVSDTSRVVFVADYNSAAAVIRQVYQTHGQLWTIVAPKSGSVADLFTPVEAEQLILDGGTAINWASHRRDEAELILTAIGAFQLEEVLKASVRLTERDVPHSVVYLLEPGRFRVPRTAGETAHAATQELRDELFPETAQARVFVTHTRPEPLLGTLGELHTGYRTTRGLGFISHGGTLNLNGMLFINHCTWAHVLEQVADVTSMPLDTLLSQDERDALAGQRSPEGVII